MENIRIVNFGGIKEEEFKIGLMNVFIGPSASGKSVIAKLLFYFKSFPKEITSAVMEDKSKQEIKSNLKQKFIEFFPRESWPKQTFKIEYKYEGSIIQVLKNNNSKLQLYYEGSILTLLNKVRSIKTKYDKEILKNGSSSDLINIRRKLPREIEYLPRKVIGTVSNFEQIFIPAGRNFFSNLKSNIFTYLSSDRSLDPFLIHFGAVYELYKNRLVRPFSTLANPKASNSKLLKELDKTFEDILGAKYVREKQKDYLLHNDKRKVNILNASSGQQETFPLLIILKSINQSFNKMSGRTLYIEEPEAHLFPTAQKKVVELLIQVFNSFRNKTQIIITTHSPYVLAAFNTSMQAGLLSKDLETKKLIKLQNILADVKWLDKPILAYSLKNGKKANLIDRKTKLIKENILDDVSEVIASEFDKMLNLFPYED